MSGVSRRERIKWQDAPNSLSFHEEPPSSSRLLIGSIPPTRERSDLILDVLSEHREVQVGLALVRQAEAGWPPLRGRGRHHCRRRPGSGLPAQPWRPSPGLRCLSCTRNSLLGIYMTVLRFFMAAFSLQ